MLIIITIAKTNKQKKSMVINGNKIIIYKWDLYKFKEMLRLKKTLRSPSPSFNPACSSLSCVTKAHLLDTLRNGDSTPALLQCLTTFSV